MGSIPLARTIKVPSCQPQHIVGNLGTVYVLACFITINPILRNKFMADAWDKAQGEQNNDPNKQPKDVAAIQKTDPRPNSNNPAAVGHQALESADEKKQSGIDIGLVSAPVQSLNPTSSNQVEDGEDGKPEYDIVDNIKFDGQDDFKYPLGDLEAGQGMFIPVEKGSSTDKLMVEMQKMVHSFREAGAVIDTDENGDQVRESVVIETKKRTGDAGLIQLDGAGKPIVGANQTNRYKLIHSASFTVKPIVKGDEFSKGNKADKDGVLVTRVM
jgi:hypothetical protein